MSYITLNHYIFCISRYIHLFSQNVFQMLRTLLRQGSLRCGLQRCIIKNSINHKIYSCSDKQNLQNFFFFKILVFIYCKIIQNILGWSIFCLFWIIIVNFLISANLLWDYWYFKYQMGWYDWEMFFFFFDNVNQQ